MRCITGWLITLIWGLCFIPAVTLAGEEPQEITAVVVRDFLPLYSVDSRGQPEGFAVDVMNRVATAKGWRVHYLIVENWEEVVEALRAKRAHLSPAVAITPNWLQEFAYSETTVAVPVSCFVRRDHHAVTSCEGLQGQRVAAIRQGAAYLYLEKQPGVQLIATDNVESSIFLLLSGAADVLTAPQSVVQDKLTAMGLEENIRLVGQPLLELKRAMMVHRDHAWILHAINPILKDYIQSNTYLNDYQKWYGKKASFWTTQRLGWSLGGVLILVTGGFLFWRHWTMSRMNTLLAERLTAQQGAETHLRELQEGLEQLVEARTRDLDESNRQLRMEIEERLTVEADLSRHHHLLESMHRIQSKFIEEASPTVFFESLLEEILRLTESRHGFITSLELNEHGAPYQACLAISRHGCGLAATDLATMQFTNFDSLFGAAIFSNTPIIANHIEDDLHRGGPLPSGHLALSNFLGIPLRLGNRVVGQVAVANRPGGYDHLLLSHLDAVTVTLAQILDAHRNHRQRRLTEEALREAEERYRLIFENAPDPIVLSDLTSWRIVDVNASVMELVGRSRWDLIGHEQQVMHPPDAAGLMSLSAAEAWPFAQPIETLVLHTDGHTVPVEVRGALITLNGRQLCQGIFRDITERVRHQQALSQAKMAAEQANRAKSAFLAAMSHEIRTPLNAILGMNELLMESGLNQDQHRMSTILQRAGRGLLALINSILDLSRIEAGQFELDRVAFPLQDMVQEALDMLTPLAESKGLFLTGCFAGDLPAYVEGDPQRLQQVLLNLVGNAIKFTITGGVRVKVCRGRGDRILFTVIDNGCGIPAGEVETIFRPFTQGSDAFIKATGGTGLGLTISKQLVELMGGSIRVRSVLGQGSTFQFTTCMPEVVSAAMVTEDPQDFWRHPMETEPQNSLAILLVDDSEDNRILVEFFLKNTPYQMDTALHGREAVEKCKSRHYDIILMDMQMPVMDGYEATRRIRQWEAESGRQAIPILALTAHAMKETTREVLAVGCNHHLTKPISKKLLLAMLRQFDPGRE